MPVSRSLVSAERELLQCFGASIDLNRVRVHDTRSFLTRVVTLLTRGSAIALGYHVFTAREMTLPVMAHELAHVCQYEEWGAVRYLAQGAWNQIMLRTLLRRDVYRWDPEPGKAFANYGMEQQGQIVQDCFDITSPRRAQAQRLSPYSPA
jgi:hypothetical protein